MSSVAFHVWRCNDHRPDLFTNEPDAALLDRFKATLSDVQFFDVLVGYFRTSGFCLLAVASKVA